MNDESRYKISHMGDSFANTLEKTFTTNNTPAEQARFSLSGFLESLISIGEFIFTAVKISTTGIYGFLENTAEVISLSTKILALESDKDQAERSIGQKIVELSRKTINSNVYGNEELTYLMDEHRLIARKISTLTMKREGILQFLAGKYKAMKSRLRDLTEKGFEEDKKSSPAERDKPALQVKPIQPIYGNFKKEDSVLPEDKKSEQEKPEVDRQKDEFIAKAPEPEAPAERKSIDNDSPDSDSLQEQLKTEDSSLSEERKPLWEIPEADRQKDEFIANVPESEAPAEKKSIDNDSPDSDSPQEQKEIQEDEYRFKLNIDDYDDIIDDEDSSEKIDSLLEDETSRLSILNSAEDNASKQPIGRHHDETNSPLETSIEDTFKLSARPPAEGETEEQSDLRKVLHESIGDH